MAQNVTIRDLAERTGTSVASVHRALYGLRGVSDELREKILAEAKASHYQPDPTASMLKRGALNIAVLLPKPEGMDRFYYRGLWEGTRQCVEGLRNARVDFTLIEAPQGIDHIGDALEELYDRTDETLNGLVTICDDESAAGWIRRFIRRGTRVALMDRGFEIPDLICSVETSMEDMARMATDIILKLSADDERPLLLMNGSGIRTSYRRYADSVQQAVNEWAPQRQLITVDTSDVDTACTQLEEVLRGDGCSGIIASGARTTYVTCSRIQELKDSLAELPPMIGTDVFEELAPYFEEGILTATIYQSHLEHGERAIRYLYDSFFDYSSRKEERIMERLSIVIRDNFKYFI